MITNPDSQGLTFVENSRAAMDYLFREGLLDPLKAGGKTGPGPRVKAVIHRTPDHHVLGLKFSGCRKRSDNGYSLVLGDRGKVAPERWADIVASIVAALGARTEAPEATLFELDPGRN